ncbi:hypothetical protein [Vibrio parahaemolyticus]|nr:hypothetical protein [Vibrio parahaemolyticus]
MAAGILALSMISNGILSKEPTKLVANDQAVLKLKYQPPPQDYSP